MKCKNCKFRNQIRLCTHPKIHERQYYEETEDESNDDHLVYSYDEGGGFDAGDNFGCVHFERKTEEQP